MANTPLQEGDRGTNVYVVSEVSIVFAEMFEEVLLIGTENWLHASGDISRSCCLDC